MIECTSFRSYEKGCLQGFANLFIPKWGVEIYGATLNMKDGKRWVNLPSKEFDENGTKKYIPIMKFRDRGLSEKFSELAKKAIEDYCAKNPQPELIANPFNEEIS